MITGALEAVAFPLMSLEILGGGAVGAALEGLVRGASGGGIRMVRGEGGALGASPGLELSGAEVVFFSRTGGAEGSARPAACSSAPMLLAPVSWFSGRKERSSSVR